MHRLCETFLVSHRGAEPVEVAPDALLDPGAPQLHAALAALGRALPGQPLAHEERQRLFQRHVGTLRGFGQTRADQPIIEHGGEVGGDARHALGADRLHPCLLDGIETRTTRGRLRGQSAMHLGIVAGETQRHGIGVAAHDRGILRIEPSRRLGQPCFRAFRGADQAGALWRVGHLELGVARHRTHATSDRPLERLLGRLGFLRGLMV